MIGSYTSTGSAHVKTPADTAHLKRAAAVGQVHTVCQQLLQEPVCKKTPQKWYIRDTNMPEQWNADKIYGRKKIQVVQLCM